MISNSIRPLLFHILFTTAIGNVSVKILQINLSSGFSSKCDNSKCDINSSDILNAFRIIKPDVVLWLSNLDVEYDFFIQSIKSFNTNASILPILTSGSQQACYVFPRNLNYSDCYYSTYLSKLNLKFLILNTFLWLKETNSSNLQLKWLEDELRKAEDKKKRVIISGYKAPGSFELSNGSLNYALKYNEKFVKLLVKYSNTIKGCIFGEKNFDTFRIVINNKRKPVLPIFISPSNNQYVRVYTFNQTINELDNYFVYQKTHSDWKKLYDYRTYYKITNMNASSLSRVVMSVLLNNTDHFKTYSNLLGNDPFEKYCKSDNDSNKENCIKCRFECFIFYVEKDFLDNCTRRCFLLDMGKEKPDKEDIEQNSGVLFVFAVIAGFVIILVGIVLAVNKVYCIRRGRQRNIFLAPLTLNIQSEIVDESQNPNLNGKSSISKVDADNNQLKNSNGFRRTNHEVEQTYNYIRM